jgi:arylsulfatase A
LVRTVNELGLAERTIFVFTSDNGPLYDKYGGTDCEFFNSHAGLRGRKGSLYEGGVRVPTIISWPAKLPKGTAVDRVTGFEDWLPTLMELAGATKVVPQGLDGISFAASLRGESQSERPFLYREFPAYGGQQSLRLGDWKGVRQKMMPQGKDAKPNLEIELYNLKADPQETTNVAAANPQIVAQIEKLLRQEHTPSRDFPFPAID